MLKSTNTKIVASGNVVEVYEFREPLFYGEQETRGNGGRSEDKERDPEEQKIIDEENRMRTMYRAKTSLKRSINANTHQWCKSDGSPHLPAFITFTFAENITNAKEANAMFTKFIKRLTYHITGEKISHLKYIAVTEFQKRGAIHFHVIFFNLPAELVVNEREQRTIADLWKHGFIDVRPIDKITSLGSYITKYMQKNFNDDRLDGKKRYFSSRGLNQPKTIRDQERADIIRSALPEGAMAYTKEQNHDYLGEFTYKLYVLPPGKTIIDFMTQEQIDQLQNSYFTL